MTAPVFLTPEEMRELTGRTMSSHQRQWLRAAGWSFAVNAAGKPIVSRAHMEIMLGGARAEAVSEQAQVARPNFDAIR